jgi:2',3'-cyclic-nucleotide 2'-phosphodiesterase (5'-nucleotidase family)
VVVMALLPGIAIWQGCNKPPALAQRQAMIVISGDTHGWIVPCGCTANQSGGLLRRGAYLRQLRTDADVLYFDAGGAGAGTSPYQQAKLEAIFSGEMAMGISAHNLGKTELAIGPDALKRLADSTHIPLLSANTRLADNTALAPNIRIFQFHGKRLGVIGLVSPRFATPAILVGDPRQAIVDTALAHRGDYDSLLVLAYLPDDELQQLAAQTPEADVIVGGPTGQSIVPRRVGPVLLASATNKGKFVIQL